MKRVFGIVFIFFLMWRQPSAENAVKISLAVNDLTAQGVNLNEAVVISEQLRAELIKFPEFKLIERSQMNEILKEQGFQQSGCTSDACAVEIGQLLGVKNITVGSVGKAGSYTVLSVRILDVGTGEVVANKSMQTRGGIDKLLEGGVKSVASALYYELFPQSAVKVKDEKHINKNLGRIAAWGGGALALVGGGIAAIILLNKDEPAPGGTQSPAANTRIELP